AVCSSDLSSGPTGKIVAHPRHGRDIGHVLALPHLGLQAALHGVLDVENTVGTLKGRSQRAAIFHVGPDDLGARGRQRPGPGTVRLAGDRPYLPAVREEMPGGSAPHATGRTQHRDSAFGAHKTS